MKRNRLLVLTISAVILAIPSLGVSKDDDDKKTSADGSPVIREQVMQRPVEWTLTPAQCPLLQVDLKGSGQGRKTVTLVRNPNGTLNYKMCALSCRWRTVQRNVQRFPDARHRCAANRSGVWCGQGQRGL